MSKQIITFGNIETKRKYKYLIGYLNYYEKIKLLYIMLPKSTNREKILM